MFNTAFENIFEINPNAGDGMKLKLGIVGGCGSSGTTLLMHLLSRHSQIGSGPEFNCFNHRELFDLSLFQTIYKKMFEGYSPPCGYIDVHVFMTFRDYYGIDAKLLDEWVETSSDTQSFFLNLCNHIRIKLNVSNFVEKSPTNVYCFKEFTKALPDVPLIHLIRDGRDVVTSLMKRGFNLFGAGSRWLYDTLAGLQARGSKSYLEIRYEDLVTTPDLTLKKIFSHLQLPFDPSLIHSYKDDSPGVYIENWKNRKEPQVWKQTPADAISTASVGRYKHELKKDELHSLYRIKLTKFGASRLNTQPLSFKELLELLNYDVDSYSEATNLKQRAIGLQYEIKDYQRRLKRYLDRRLLRLPRRFTYISY